ncbi:hypothetical protein [Bacillus sp. SJS]|uniref:hypothetical protein n=1 Tax=Bacillus sp. SJS TaxID=1423321 RepID=UPI0004DD2140|nr:hypothetical protein [Bacillus sp. SJS]KZZ82628.1 hypothetical protein AS29_017580 [Bacillus sp. SJS]
MIKALKLIVIPLLREKGFKGSFSHFLRVLETRIDLISFFLALLKPGVDFYNLLIGVEGVRLLREQRDR